MEGNQYGFPQVLGTVTNNYGAYDSQGYCDEWGTPEQEDWQGPRVIAAVTRGKGNGEKDAEKGTKKEEEKDEKEFEEVISKKTEARRRRRRL